MDTPGYDIASVSAMVAGGAQIIAFTTGRGTPTGHALAPVVKITGNKETFNKMFDNMDIDVSDVILGKISIEEASNNLFNEIIKICNGKKTKAEIFGFSDIAINRICKYI